MLVDADMLNLNDLALFAAAVEHGGFSPAARHLGVPKSTISKRVAELEAQLAARLIHRTSRSFALTDVGSEFYDRARATLIEAEAAEQVVRSRVAEPSGTVRLTTSVPTAQLYLAAHLPQLARAHPKLHVQITVTDRFVDLVQEGFDIAVRSHFEPLADSGLVQRRLTVDPIILVAAPAYLRERGHGALKSPHDLVRHAGLLTGSTTWTLSSAGGETLRIAPIARFTANETTVLLEAALVGLGVVCAPARFCRAALETGQLIHVLPGWTAGSVTTTLLVPHRRGQLSGVRATIDFLAHCLTAPLP
jgi:DNA-binding transcriptional LysR family regulator